MAPRLAHKPLIHIVLISLLGLLAYSNTFDVPFQFDDTPAILENAPIKDISNVPALLAGLKGSFASRPLLQATLALNYYFGAYETRGYHAVNLALHLLNAIFLYFLVVMTGRHLRHEESDIRPVALLSSLLFVVHPAQTQTVANIVNRSMLLATAFYLLGIMLFLKAATSEKKRGLYIAGLLAVSMLGMGSREDFATFPVMLFLYDIFFISRFSLREAAKHYKAYVPVLMSLGYLVYLVADNTYDRSADFPAMDMPRLDYVLTQFKVHWTYLRLLVLPLNQNLDYDYPISRTLFDLPTLLSFMGYVALWCLCIVFGKRKPLTAFSVLWSLVALLPISFGVVLMKGLKLDDVIFEHRLYLPAVALFPLAAAGMLRLGDGLKARRRSALAVSISAVLVIVLISATFTRNIVWQSKVGLWEDVVKKSPGKSRGHNNVGSAYRAAGLIDGELEHFVIAMGLEPDDAMAHNNLGTAYADKGALDDAIEEFQTALRLKPGYADAHDNLGLAYKLKGLTDKAIEEHEHAVRLNPSFAMAHVNLGNAYYSKGLVDQAIEEYGTAVRLKPDFAMAHYTLGTAYGSRGLTDMAIEHFLIALRLKPDYADAHYNLGVLYFKRGVMEKARKEFEAVLSINPADLEAREYLERPGK